MKEVHEFRQTSDGIKFPIANDSPFADKFDLTVAKEMVKDLYAADEPDSLDPRYPLLMLVWDHEVELKKLRAERKLRNNAEDIVPFSIAASRPGRLTQESRMVLHTAIAQRLFTGRKHVPGEQHGIPGVLRFANACYWLWHMTGDDNPYADWGLIQVGQSIREMEAELKEHTGSLRQLLEERARRGLRHSVAESETPLAIDEVNFGSPYVYIGCDLLLEFDFWVRMVQTLEAVGQISTQQRQKMLYDIQRKMRSLTQLPVKLYDNLRRKALAGLTRDDFKPEASEEARQRVALAKELLGEIPEDILSGKQRPDHYRQVRRASAEE